MCYYTGLGGALDSGVWMSSRLELLACALLLAGAHTGIYSILCSIYLYTILYPIHYTVIYPLHYYNTTFHLVAPVLYYTLSSKNSILYAALYHVHYC
jgi:hypothetical protein